MIIYVSGKYSGDIDANIEAARKMAIKVWESGHTALTPHLNTFHFEKDCACKYEDYICGDIELLLKCDAILMLPGWEESKGARIEHDYAKLENILVFYSMDEIPDVVREIFI